MDKIFETLKEKLESPVLLNYFIGLLLFNRKVVYTALSMDYHDRVGHFYLYKGNMYNSKIEMLSVVYGEEQIWGWSTLYIWPIIYAIGVAIALPYIKAVSNTVHENADVFYERFRVRFNKMKTVSEERYNSVNTSLGKALIEGKSIANENNELRNEISTFNEKIKNSQIEIGTSRHENAGLTSENESLKREISEIRSTLRDNEPSMTTLFKGIWKFDYEFEPEYKGYKGGTEYMKVLNQCEIHTATEPYGEYKLRCYIDRYQFFKEQKRFMGEFFDMIRFKKGFLNPNETSTCEYFAVGKDLFRGEESYSDDNNQTIGKTKITITLYRDVLDDVLDELKL